MVTLKSVAAEAGVSLATASRAFKDTNLLSASTQRKVVTAALKLGYDIPVQRKAQHTFAVVVPDSSNAVYATMMKSIQERAWSGRHLIYSADTGEDPLREIEILSTMGKTVDGIVLCSPRAVANTIKEAIGTTPTVVVNGEVAPFPQILMETENGLYQAVEHLHSLGHRHIAYVAGPKMSWANTQRHRQIGAITESHSMQLTVMRNQAASTHGGLAAAASVAACGATAVIAYNDLVALGLEAGLRTLGLHCPEDISIVGIDDLDVAAIADPGMTTVRLGVNDCGTTSIDQLIKLVEQHEGIQQTTKLESQLIVRGSTARKISN
ncbi:LacI family DNA-binding transcriptional regulator [Arthrobacter sp. MYb213]|uniref:LacI family DNA-binding transcriptional regulator n=1 Tax=Arthrobacter sp. MYb213 TaxID=1848595 RepID=UPI000CFD9903|nr:LacI family DNA-binding transcriptional regulator [Arthrobacter sp. MYb213]PRB66815.1 LacI family transcriptional regulator [Arthrobacter sp. MYb213]